MLATSGESRAIRRAERRLQMAKRRVPARLSGKSVFVKELMRIGMDRKRRMKSSDPTIAKQVIKIHGKMWRGLAPERRAMLEGRALRGRQRAEQAREESIAEASAELRLLRRREAAESGGDVLPPLRMSNAAWSGREADELDQLYRSLPLSQAEIDRKLSQHLQPIGPLEPNMQAVLEDIDIGDATMSITPPVWVRTVTKFREMFCDAVFRITDSDGNPLFLKMVFGRQAGPVMAGFVLALPVVHDDDVTAGTWWERERYRWRHVFRLQMTEWVFSDQAEFGADWTIEVASDIVMIGDGLAATDADFRPFDESRSLFESKLEEFDEDEPEEVPPKHADADREQPVWHSLPWLLDAQHIGPDLAREAAPSSMVPGGSADGDADDLEVDADFEAMSFEEAMGALYERRLAWSADAGDELIHFQWTIRGGKWTADHMGMAYDSVRGMASRGRPCEFCVTFGMPTSATYSFKLYSEANAVGLSKVWCHKLQWCYSKFLGHEGSPDLFCDEMMAGYREPIEAEQLVANGNAAVQTRLAGIRALRPRRPGGLAV